jgi:hypothetical protein
MKREKGVSLGAAALFGKGAIRRSENFELRTSNPRVSPIPRRMLKKARLPTRPTLAHRDAPYPKQGRSERRGEAYAAVR